MTAMLSNLNILNAMLIAVLVVAALSVHAQDEYPSGSIEFVLVP